ncbi:class I SAM-dependent methyltransferase [Bombilactobacillus folatiphilus]|uniref:Class I SAM-dependent methyltransferase n=1 Tax=Bombilactobacillus folatiphilus TaxID=2923362 RepID=A0ABY4P714_9LACO|nr:class I SAM-dependent methyltransferase [Bombilactobacillus folatiphilus]UQS81513.1 class I SAM-dependent methyltransferase [Bombilactobacillus folatiphilus]
MVKLSRRLQVIADLIPKVSCAADIGSDHAYIPIHLVQNQQISTAIATEVAVGPLTVSQKDIQAAQLQDVIATRLGDGLGALAPTDRVQAAVIAGMGGQLISQILERGQKQLRSIECLVLEPNNDEPQVRRWLNQHHFAILEEEIVQDGHHIYEVIKAQKQSNVAKLTPMQILFGPILLQQKSAIFQKKWQHKLKQYQMMYNNLQQAKKPDCHKMHGVRQQIQQIEEILQ